MGRCNWQSTKTHHVVAVEQLLGDDAGQAAQHVRAGVDDDRLLVGWGWVGGREREARQGS
jgi:hypothetical protein